MKKSLIIFIILAVLQGSCAAYAQGLLKEGFDFENFTADSEFSEDKSFTAKLTNPDAGSSRVAADASGNKFLKLKNNGGAAAGLFAAYECRAADYARIKYKIRFHQMQDWHSLYLNDGNLISLAVTGGYFSLNWGGNTQAIAQYGAVERLDTAQTELNRWYEVCLMVNAPSKTVRIYIDNVFVGERPFRSAAAALTSCNFYYTSAKAADFDLDDFEATLYDAPGLYAQTPEPEVGNLTAGENRVTLVCENFTGAQRKIYPFVLVYKDGVLIKAQSCSFDTFYGDGCVQSSSQMITFNLTVDEAVPGTTARVFVWDGFDTRRSLTGAPLSLSAAAGEENNE